MGGIKIKTKELKQKSTEELIKMKKEMKHHLVMSFTIKGLGQKGFNPKEERKNIARINTLLRERNELPKR